MAVSLILLIAALIAFFLDTIGISSRINLTALGLALVTLALKILAEIAEDESKSTAARVTAASAVLDRGLGKPMQMVGDDDGNPISWIEFLTGARSRALRDEHDTVQ
jgi:hypothetical protein